MLAWLVVATALLLALAAWLRAAHLSRKVERLTQAYWELRYAHGQVRARLDRLDPQAGADAPTTPPAGNFVPLSSLVTAGRSVPDRPQAATPDARQPEGPTIPGG
jgi:hypothetical protein